MQESPPGAEAAPKGGKLEHRGSGMFTLDVVRGLVG